ncbi:hypothetical protein J28TS4_06250 [Paenibacillus lautus]|nr:hypothetical protein J28TS4_06250 [Paenibacillus lautus]
MDRISSSNETKKESKNETEQFSPEVGLQWLSRSLFLLSLDEKVVANCVPLSYPALMVL